MNNKKHTGFNLIELMVAMLIGLFLLGAVLTLYAGNKKSYQEQQQFIMLEEAGRNALFELRDVIQHTGYRTANLFPITSNFITGAVAAASCNGTGVDTTSTNVADTTIINTTTDAAIDTIGVVYFGDNTLSTDCSGETLPADCLLNTSIDPMAAKIYSSFSIATVGSIPELQCLGSLSSTATTLVKGVENIQINYGVDQNMNGRVDNYMNATMVTAEAAWNQVISVQIAVLVRTLKEVKETAVAQSYALLDTEVDIAADKYHRAVFTTLIRLPNTQP
ncbi:MAG: PilW family protein [Thiotrichaceae bacterium]